MADEADAFAEKMFFDTVGLYGGTQAVDLNFPGSSSLSFVFRAYEDASNFNLNVEAYLGAPKAGPGPGGSFSASDPLTLIAKATLVSSDDPPQCRRSSTSWPSFRI